MANGKSQQRSGYSKGIIALALLLAFCSAKTDSTAANAALANCDAWAKHVFSVQAAATIWINAGLYDRSRDDQAVSALREADVSQTSCSISPTTNEELFAMRLGTKQLLVAALLGSSQFHEARITADDVLKDSKLIGYGAGGVVSDASDLVIKSQFKKALQMYQSHAAGFVSSAAEIALPVWSTYLRALKYGADGDSGTSVRLFATFMPTEYRDMVYTYGVTLRSAGEPCKAYKQFRAVLSMRAVSTIDANIVFDATTWSSLRAIDGLYLKRSSDSDTLAIMHRC